MFGSLIFMYCFVKYCMSCGPPMSSESFNQLSPLPSSPESNSRLHGDLTHTGNLIQLDKTPGSVTTTVELFCYHFDSSCAWSNMAGLFVDELDWMQGSSALNPSRIFQATMTTELPDQGYAIVATDKTELPDAKAVLVSKIIECQTGRAELRFRYWTSPSVHIVVCTKSVQKPYPNYDYCSQTLEICDPGPAYISIPDLDGVPFQIYIRAENFVFQHGNLHGGFAIIDDIEYYGDFCTGQQRLPLMSSPNFGNPLSIAPVLPFLNDAVHSTNDLSQLMTISIKPLKNNSVGNEACLALNCTFDEGECVENVKKGFGWVVSNHSVGNPLTGIRGGASHLPYNQKGAFAYVTGPKPSAKFRTRNFTLETDVYFMFSYHKVAKYSEFSLKSKRTNESKEEILFEAPRLKVQSRRWFREIRELLHGNYDYLIFEARNVSANEYIGIDELMILNENQQPFCTNIKLNDTSTNNESLKNKN